PPGAWRLHHRGNECTAQPAYFCLSGGLQLTRRWREQDSNPRSPGRDRGPAHPESGAFLSGPAEPDGVSNQRACDRTLIPYLAALPRQCLMKEIYKKTSCIYLLVSKDEIISHSSNSKGIQMKHATLGFARYRTPMLAVMVTLGTLMFTQPSHAAACVNGVYRAGCAGPNG